MVKLDVEDVVSKLTPAEKLSLLAGTDHTTPVFELNDC
jgi:hypothetical protein